MTRASLVKLEIAEFARRLKWFRRKRRLTQEALAEKCNQIARQASRGMPHIRRDHVAKLEAAARQGSSGATVLYAYELCLLARALEIDDATLAGIARPGLVYRWDIRHASERAKELAELAEFHDAMTAERLVWSEPLPCSLQPPWFWQRYQASMYPRKCGAYAPANPAPKLVASGAFAEANRTRTWNRFKAKTLRMKAVLPLATIEAIAAGRGAYQHFTREERSQCLAWLSGLLHEHSEHLQVVLAAAEDLRPLQHFVAAHEAVYVLRRLVNWFDRCWVSYFSEAPDVVDTFRLEVQALYDNAQIREPAEVRAIVHRAPQQLQRPCNSRGRARPRQRVA